MTWRPACEGKRSAWQATCKVHQIPGSAACARTRTLRTDDKLHSSPEAQRILWLLKSWLLRANEAENKSAHQKMPDKVMTNAELERRLQANRPRDTGSGTLESDSRQIRRLPRDSEKKRESDQVKTLGALFAHPLVWEALCFLPPNQRDSIGDFQGLLRPGMLQTQPLPAISSAIFHSRVLGNLSQSRKGTFCPRNVKWEGEGRLPASVVPTALAL